MSRARLILAPLLAALAFALALRFGMVESTWADVWAALAGGEGDAAQMLRDFRLPRTLIALLTGAHFALAGMMMQVAMRNPLADPTIFGVSGGAAFAITATMLLGAHIGLLSDEVQVTRSYLPAHLMPPIAIIGAALATGAVLVLGRRDGFSSGRIVLTGVMIGAVLNGLVMGCVLALGTSQTEMAIIWLSGALYGRNMGHLWQILPWSAACLALALLWLRALSILRFAPDMALSLGLDDRRMRPLAMLTAAALAASAVAVSGPVGFVGLIVPHGVRLLHGPSIAGQMWLNITLGAALVTLADLLGRVMFAPIEVPVGIVTSLIAAPVFIAILRSKLKG